MNADHDSTSARASMPRIILLLSIADLTLSHFIAMLRDLVFITSNRYKHTEVSRLLAGIDVRWEHLVLPRPESEDLSFVAHYRVLEAYRRLQVPCFLESTGLYLDEYNGFPGSQFKKTFIALGEDVFCQKFGGAHGTAMVAVAYTEDGVPERVRMFEGEISGTLLACPRGEGGYGWDRVWQPDGYERTLAEMLSNKYLVNMRHAPYLELADLVRGRTYGGTFEAHVTVRAGSSEELERFRLLCDRLGVKCVLIELPEGQERSQPMTASYHRGELREVQEEVHALARELVKDGFDVTRSKIEATGKNCDIPEDDDEAARTSSANYFEYHVKLVLPESADLESLALLCRKHDAHLSKNARNARRERFVTLRVHHAGRKSAEAKFDALLEALKATEYPMTNRLREYTVYDSNVRLDRGWLEP